MPVGNKECPALTQHSQDLGCDPHLADLDIKAYSKEGHCLACPWVELPWPKLPTPPEGSGKGQAGLGMVGCPLLSSSGLSPWGKG